MSSPKCPICEILLDPHQDRIIKIGTYVTAISKQYPSPIINLLVVSNQHLESHATATNEQSREILDETMRMAKELFPDANWSLRVDVDHKSQEPIRHLSAQIYSTEKWPADSRWDSLACRIKINRTPPK